MAAADSSTFRARMSFYPASFYSCTREISEERCSVEKGVHYFDAVLKATAVVIASKAREEL